MVRRVLATTEDVDWDTLAFYDLSCAGPGGALTAARTADGRLFVCVQLPSAAAAPGLAVQSALLGNTVLREGGRPVLLFPASARLLLGVLSLETASLGAPLDDAALQRLCADCGAALPTAHTTDALVRDVRSYCTDTVASADVLECIRPLFRTPALLAAVQEALLPGQTQAPAPKRAKAVQTTLNFARVIKK